MTCDDYCPIKGEGSNSVSGFIQEITEEKTESSTGQSHRKQVIQSLFSFQFRYLNSYTDPQIAGASLGGGGWKAWGNLSKSI